ncbi:hypothetical protein EDF69_001272 [Sphingomonas sp. JUb134]|nr:hypothetical protein [Sphingomonas sp. JUb134]
MEYDLRRWMLLTVIRATTGSSWSEVVCAAASTAKQPS